MDKNLVKNNLAGVLENEPLARFTTYRIGGPADFFFDAKNDRDLRMALKLAKETCVPVFILGGGSNLLFSDEGFRGLVIKVGNMDLEQRDGGRLVVGAGTKLIELAGFARKFCLTGLEWAAGIPGTVGGAIRGNAGAFGKSISDCVESVKYLDLEGGEIKEKTIAKESCGFGYRDSIFKKNKNLVIVSCEIFLEQGNNEQIESAMKDCLAKKRATQPLEFPSAGSVFVNPPNASAGKLIEDCGFKGKRIGGAQVSEKHANFIINTGDATARDIKELVAQIKKAVKEKFGAELAEEIEIVG